MKRPLAKYRVFGWGSVLDTTARTVGAAIKRLRRLLGDKCQPRIEPDTAIEKGISIECRGKVWRRDRGHFA